MVLNGSVWINLVQTLVLVRVLVLVQVLILLTIISSAKELNTAEWSVRPYLLPTPYLTICSKFTVNGLDLLDMVLDGSKWVCMDKSSINTNSSTGSSSSTSTNSSFDIAVPLNNKLLSSA